MLKSASKPDTTWLLLAWSKLGMILKDVCKDLWKVVMGETAWLSLSERTFSVSVPAARSTPEKYILGKHEF